MIVTAASILFGTAAYAGNARNFQSGPFHEGNSEYRTTGPQYTVEQINNALAARGKPPLGTSRVLHDDNAVRPGETRTTITHIHR